MGHGDHLAALSAIGQALKGIGGALERLEALLKEHDDRSARRQTDLLERLDCLLVTPAPPERPPALRGMLDALRCGPLWRPRGRQ
jgi:hypothetical protein